MATLLTMATQRPTSARLGALKLKEAANYLAVSPISVRRLIQRGLIKPNRALRHILIPIGELDRFLAEGQR
jgi:excisionase family DNA binding protein